MAFVVLRSHPDELWDALRDVDYRLALLSVAAERAGASSSRPCAPRFFLRRQGHAVPARLLIPTTVLGFVAGGLTPAASGELLRAAILRARAAVPIEDTLAVIAYERVLALYLLVVSAGAFLSVSALPPALAALGVTGSLLLCLAPWLLATRLTPRRPADAEAAAPAILPSLARRLLTMAAQFHVLLRDGALYLRWSLVTAAMFGLIALQYWLLARAVAPGVDFAEAWVALGVSSFAGVASLLPLGLGVLDSSLAAVLESAGMTLEQGAAVALLVRAAVTLPPVFLAFASYLFLQADGVVTPDVLAADVPRTPLSAENEPCEHRGAAGA